MEVHFVSSEALLKILIRNLTFEDKIISFHSDNRIIKFGGA